MHDVSGPWLMVEKSAPVAADHCDRKKAGLACCWRLEVRVDLFDSNRLQLLKWGLTRRIKQKLDVTGVLFPWRLDSYFTRAGIHDWHLPIIEENSTFPVVCRPYQRPLEMDERTRRKPIHVLRVW